MRRGIINFFRYARLRHEAYLAKRDGVPKGSQSKDPILREYRFTNVFRELDKTTQWFAKHVRDPLRDRPEVLLATVLFRLLNRIEVGEAIFCQTNVEYENAFAHYLATDDVRVLRRAIVANCGSGPYCTGAYIISSPRGYSKLDGMMEVIRRFAERRTTWMPTFNSPHYREIVLGWRELGTKRTRDRLPLVTLENVHRWLAANDYFGPFHSYEIVTDLRHTALLEQAPDIMKWASVGPGCRRGLNRAMGRDKRDHTTKTADMLDEMHGLLVNSRDPDLWSPDWPRWEMREVEHTLCEFDKYERVRLGEGRPRGVYR